MKKSVRMVLIAGSAAGALLLAALPAATEKYEVDLDQGADVGKVLEHAREGALTMTWDDAALYRPSRRYRWTEDCARISFAASDPPVSERFLLESRLYRTRCREYTDEDGRRREECRERFVRSERRRVRIEILDRGRIFPWERDVFRVCMKDTYLDARVIDASHRYDIMLPGYYGDTIEARAGDRVRTDPDPAGIYLDSFRSDPAARNFRMLLGDRWESYYRGERTVIALKLKRHRTLWFDDTVLEKEISFATTETYGVRFADYANEFQRKLEPGSEYYVKWAFSRLGRVSKPTWQGDWQTQRLKFDPGAGVYVMAGVPAQASPAADACWYRRIEERRCVYRCEDGRVLRRPVLEREESGTIPCAQLIGSAER